MARISTGQTSTPRTSTPYCYRGDPAVPAFPDDKPVLVFDGVCALCSGWARFVMRHDPDARIRLLPAQSELGRALYRHYGLDPYAFETNILLADGWPRLRLEATIRTAEILGRPWSGARILRALPPRLSDWLYERVARNRYALFGRREACFLPSPAEAGRFLA